MSRDGPYKGEKMIDYGMREKCLAALETMQPRQIYDTIFTPQYGTSLQYESFKRAMRRWKRSRADTDTLYAGTYPQFTAHGATVQVDGNGKITQAWIKQSKDVDWAEIRETLTADLPKSDITPTTVSGSTMLEIPLFDLHFGIASFDAYKDALADIIGTIAAKSYDEINIIIGQDALHNNDMRGHTAKGTLIEQVDFTKAWADAWRFFRSLIDVSLMHSPRVRLHYSKGNHDECSAWCLFKALEAVYPQCQTDDSLAPRKCIFWRGCFIGFGHCNYTSKNSVIFQNFVLDFPDQFAKAKVREIHSGHLHRESVDDGIFVRRLPSAVPTDQWSSDNGFIGAHKRFMIFEWAESRLRAIYYA